MEQEWKKRSLIYIHVPLREIITFYLTFMEVHVSINIRIGYKLFWTEWTFIYRPSVCKGRSFAHGFPIDGGLHYSKSVSI